MKLITVLFCVLMMSGYAFADELSYEIDQLATAKAPWKVGEKIVEEGSCEGTQFDRKFLGMAQSGFALMQDFYLSEEKFSDPYLMTVTNAEKYMIAPCGMGLEGTYTMWYKNGQKRGEANFKNGKAESPVVGWHENGQMYVQGRYQNDSRVGIWQYWDEKGNLIEEKDYGAPKD